MKVLHVISSGGMYGAEAVILNLSRTLNREGHQSMLGIFSNSTNPNTQLHDIALGEGIHSELISCVGQIDRSVPRSIRNLAESTGADVVHAHGYKADVYTWLALRRTPLPFVSTCHNWIDDSRIVWLYGVADRHVLRRYGGVVAVSEPVRHRLISSGVSPERIHLIRNGIDLRPFDSAVPALIPPAAAGSLAVGWVGRLSHEKGPDLFLRAAASAHRELPLTRFYLIGDGPDRASLEDLVVSLGLTDAVEFLGRQTDMPAIYASLDVLVSSSRREGLPMAVLEGMASRLPWVATDVGDVPTLVQNNVTGALVPPEDPDALARALAALLESQPDRQRLGSAARALVERDFSAERMASEYLHVYAAATAIQSTEGEPGVPRAASRSSH